MTASELISVVIPAYNRADVIVPALQSVLRQTWCNLEVIVVDDSSTDDTVAAVRSVQDPRITIVQCDENAGPSRARNIGIAHAKGDWIAFQDSDDEWLPTKLERQMARVAQNDPPWGAVYCAMAILEDLDLPHGQRHDARVVPPAEVPLIEGELLPTLVERSIISTQMLMVRANILRDTGGFDETLKALVDWELVLRIADKHLIAIANEILVLQRFSKNSITKNRSRRVASRDYVLTKHHDLFARWPQMLAHQYMVQSGELRLLRRYSEAREAMAKARAITPVAPMLWVKTARLIGEQMFAVDKAER